MRYLTGNLAWLNGSYRTCGVFRSPRLESPWLFSKEEFPKFFQNSDQDFRGGHSWKLDFPCFILAGQCIWSTSTEYTSQVPCDLVFQYHYYFLYMSHTSIFYFSEVKIWFALVWFFFCEVYYVSTPEMQMSRKLKCFRKESVLVFLNLLIRHTEDRQTPPSSISLLSLSLLRW